MSSVIEFAKRHKKKLIFTTILFGGGYCGFKYSMYKMKQFLLQSTNTADLVNEQMLTMRKTEHYLSIKETSNQGVLSLIKSMHTKINEQLSSEELLGQLKQRPENRLVIWETLKIKCLSKSLTNIYVTALLTLFIKIELNIIGAYLFLSNSQATNSNEDWSSEFLQQQENTLSAHVQQSYLENIENFIRTGLPELIAMIENFCDEEFSSVSLKENLTVDFIGQKLENIQQRINANVFDLDEKENFISKHMLSNIDLTDSSCNLMVWNDNKQIKSDEEVLLGLNLETYDILASSDFQLTLNSLLQIFTNEYLNTLTSQIVQQLVSTEASQSGTMLNQSMPFARLIPILNTSSSVFEMNSLKNRMLNDATLNIFSENIYEAFSVPKKTMMLFENENSMNASMYDKDSMNGSIYNKDSMLNQVI